MLCGGKSERLGVNKALLKLNSQILIEYLIKKVRKYFKNIFVIVKDSKEAKKMPSLDAEIITDIIKDKQGAIFGLHTVFHTIKKETIFVISCDTPLADLASIRYIVEALGEHNAVIPRWPNGYIEPLYAVYKRRITLPIVEKNIKSSIYSLKDLISKIPKVLYFSTKIIEKFDPKLNCFFNVNTRRDYILLLKKIKR
ncbi:MAG: molybdenum cofactor guanylyltransferase [Candidatus Odinarchaeia archaeon]